MNLAERRSSLIEALLVTAILLAFVDESVRKMFASQPIYVTSVKQGVVLLAGVLILFAWHAAIAGIRLLLFLPWSIYTLISGTLVSFDYDAPRLVFAVIATYCSAPLLFAVGYYLGLFPDALRKVSKIFLIGAIAAIIVAILQEFIRSMLPGFLAVRVYKESHVCARAACTMNHSLRHLRSWLR